MDKMFISKRAKFQSISEQIYFFKLVKQKSDIGWKGVANLLGVNQRSVLDWSKGRFSAPYSYIILLARKYDISSDSIQEFDFNDHLKSISSKGGKTNFKKNKVIGGDNKYRKTKWKEWWKKVGKESSIFSARSIIIPSQNEDLAEFVGIMIGDGGIAEYHISVTLDSSTDSLYKDFVTKLISKLFGVTPKLYKKKSSRAIDVVVQRKSLVHFLMSQGLPKGNKIKQKITIPKWIILRKSYTISCVRGLFDTDGTFFIHKYKVKGKEYQYLKIAFTSSSKALIKDLKVILQKLGINVRISKNFLDIRIENQEDVRRFIEIIGSHNPKHLKKLL